MPSNSDGSSTFSTMFSSFFGGSDDEDDAQQQPQNRGGHRDYTEGQAWGSGHSGNNGSGSAPNGSPPGHGGTRTGTGVDSSGRKIKSASQDQWKMFDAYQLLQVSRDSTSKEIIKSYRDLARQW